jgi:hypothetical protein
MANTQAVCDSFKTELLNGIHAFGTTVTRGGTGADTFKAALYLASATYNSSTTAYSTTGEVSGTNYTSGGATFTWSAPASSGGTTYTTPSANISWTNVTLSTSFDAVLLYNDTQGDKAIAVYTFGGTTVTAGNFTLTMPTNNSSTGLLRLS